jgi:hypothetical protein
MAEPETTNATTEKKRTSRKKANGPEPKLEALLWAAADRLRGQMDAAEYNHDVLDLIFHTLTQTRALTNLREALLLKLFSGQLSVAELATSNEEKCYA